MDDKPALILILPLLYTVFHCLLMLKRNPCFHVAPLLFLSGIYLLATDAPAIELSLRNALELAPTANFQVLLAREAVTAQGQSVRSARSALLPQVQMQASQFRAMAPNTDPLALSFPEIPDRFYVDRFDAVLRTSLSLVNTRSMDDWRISKLTLRATQLQLDNTVQDILQMIANAYFTHWRNQRRLEVIDTTLERDRILLQIATDQKEAGVATALDVTRAEVGLARNELVRLQQETMVMESSLLLKRILNLSLGEPLVLTDSTIGDASQQDIARFNLEAVLAQRADYQQLLSELERQQLAHRATKRERLPDLTLSGQWGYASPTISDDLREQWAIQLGVSMPVFEGFRLDSQQRIAASLIRQKEIQLSDLKSQIEMDYRLVIQQLQSSWEQVSVARRSRNLNEREYDLEKIRFQQGVADNSDVVNAQTRLADSEDALVEAEYQHLLAKIELARVEGHVQTLGR